LTERGLGHPPPFSGQNDHRIPENYNEWWIKEKKNTTQTHSYTR
jgi:hypothetical protein